jgi:phage tail sheath protein FI
MTLLKRKEKIIPEKNFSLNITGAIKSFTSILNSSYSTTYACWTKVYDAVLDDQTWVPFSGTAAEIMANTDANFQPWFAPAGFTRGRVGSVNDIVLYPKQKQRDQLYKNSVNPVAFFPGDGFVVFGQKTLHLVKRHYNRHLQHSIELMYVACS